MGYTLLGKLVWHGGRWYLRRRYPNLRRRLTLTVAGAALLGAGVAVLAGRRQSEPG